ncbi:MAG: hypothetical protein ACTH64_16090 [Providencia sp.]
MKKIGYVLLAVVALFMYAIYTGKQTPKQPSLTENDIEQQVQDAHNFLINKERLRKIYSSDIEKTESYAYDVGMCVGYYNQQAITNPVLKDQKKFVKQFYDAQVNSMIAVLPLSSKQVIYNGIEHGMISEIDGDTDLNTKCTQVYMNALNSKL